MKAFPLALAILLTGCFEAPIQTAGETISTSSRMREVKTKLADNGVTSGHIDPKSTYPQMVSVPEGSTVSGSSVVVPPGALAIAADIMIEAAMPLATATGMAEMAINAVATRSGVPVSVQASEMVDAKTPMTIALPIPVSIGLAEINDANIVVMYRVAQNEAGRNVAGIIPRSQITIEGTMAKITTRFFGAFQVVEFSEPVSAMEIAVATPAFAKSTVESLPGLEITHLSEVVAQSGKRLQVTGKNFRSSMVLAIGGKLVKDLKVISESVASFIVPTAAAAGRMTLAGEQDGVTQSVPVFYLPGTEDLPIITLTTAEVCAGTRYYDRAGAVQTGKKVCGDTASAAVAASDIRSGVVVGGVTGTLAVPANCSQDGDTGCVVQGPAMAAAVTSGLSGKVVAGNTVAGIAGSASLSGAPADCTGSGQTGCVAVTNYPSVDKSYLMSNKGLYPSTLSIAGIVGTLSTCSYDGAFNCLAHSSFPAVDTSNLDFSTIRMTTTVGGVPGSMPECSSEGDQNCYAFGNWKSTNPLNYGPWDIRSGKMIAGVSGKVAFYRSGATLSVFNETIIGGASSDTLLADNFDSIDDDNGGVGVPTLAPAGGPAALPALAADRPIQFDSAFDSNTNSACDGGESCVFIDLMTGLRWYYPNANEDFATAATTCQTLSKGTLTTGWRLPSQKELQMAYINGIWATARQFSWTNLDYWTATSVSYNTDKAHHVMLSDGSSDVSFKTDLKQVICAHSS